MSTFAPLQFLKSAQNPLVWTAIDNGTDTRTSLVIYYGAVSTLPADTGLYEVNCILMHQAEKQLYANTGTVDTPNWEAFGPNSALPQPLVPGTFLFTDGATVYWATQLVGQVQYNASNLNQYGILNFNDFLVASNDVPNSRINVDLDVVALAADTTFINAVSSNLDLSTIGGLLDWTQVDQSSVSVDLSTQVTGVLNSTNIDITNLESTLYLGNITGQIDLTTQVVGQLPATNIDVAGLITAINLTGDIEVVTDGTTITGNGTTASPLTATPGIGGDIVVALTAGEDLTAGDTVGYASFADDTAIKAVWAERMSTSASITLQPNDIFSITEIDTDKYVIAYGDISAPSGAYRCIVATLDRSTLTWTFGARSSSLGIIVTGNVAVVKLDTDKFAVARFTSATNPYTIEVRVCTVSGTNISLQSTDSFSEPSTDNGSMVSLAYLDVDRFAMLITGTQASSHCDLFEVTVSGNTPSIGTQNVIESSTTTIGLITKVDTDKVIFTNGTKIWCAEVAAGVWTVGTHATLSSSTGTLRQRIGLKSNSTSGVYSLTSNSSTTVTIQYFSITGTSLSPVASTTKLIGSAATLATDGTDIYIVTQGGVSGANGNAKISVSGASVIISPFVSFDINPDFTALVVFSQLIFEGSDYFGTIKDSQGTGGSSTTYQLDFNEFTMTPYFSGIAQSTVSKGATLNVKIAGVDSNQTGLTAGTLYDAFEGGIVSTPTQLFNSLQAQSSTDIKI